MVDRLSATFYGLMSFALLVLTACSPPAATKPEMSPPPSQSAFREKPVKEAGETTGPSSFEALRRGEAPVTPASSPVREVYFDYDRYDLRSDARDTLKANAVWLKANPAMQMEIEGHADERGTNEYN